MTGAAQTLPFTGLYTGMLLLVAITLLVAGIALLRIVHLRQADRAS
ncbi:putative membrane protein [Candidatus Protofrankia californiensis]|uniref:Putative membrane protein n=1 Tax=Candidatus Protofrankia californiensis TaxID=1839754 RepID=A0A1C3NTR9_9ACTN|nr:putative membrane protein [Candidatus Protofrankia californiensis]